MPPSGCRSAPPATAGPRSRRRSTRTTSLATTQAICEYRAAQGIDGPLYLGADTHALSEPAQVSALEVLAANGVLVLCDARGGYTPTPAVSRAILVHNASGQRPAGRRDRGHAVAQPAAGRRLQVQPARRRAGRHRHHPADPGPGQRPARRRAGRRAPDPVRPGGRGRHHRAVRLPRRLRVGARAGGGPGRDQGGRGAHRRRPARRGQRRPTGARSASATAWTSPSSTRAWTPRSGS